MTHPVDNDIGAIRSRVADLCLIGLGLAALPALAGSLSRLFDSGWLPVMNMHLALAAAAIGVALLRRRLSYTVRAGFLVGVFFLIGVGGLCTLGLMSGPQLHFVAASILAFALFGTPAGLCLVGMGVVTVFAVYGLTSHGLLPARPQTEAYLESLGSWITAATSLALTATVIGISLSEIFRSMVEALERTHRQNAAFSIEMAERRRAEAARVDQEMRAQAIVDHAPAVIFVKDLDGRFVLINRGFEAQYGITADDMIGQTDAAIVSPALAELFRSRDLQVIASGQPQELEHVHDSGRERRVFATVRFPIRDRNGQIRGVGGISTDITERKQAEFAAEEARASLRDAIDSINQAIVLYDRDDRIAVFNNRFAEAFAHSAAVGLRFEDFMRLAVAKGIVRAAPGEEEAVVAERLRQHLNIGGPPFIEELPDGRKFSMVRTSSTRGGIVTVATDITEQLKTEERLREMQKMEAIGKLTGGMAHDFNNYLTIIIGNLGLLRGLEVISPTATQLVDSAQRGAVLAADLVRSLLAFSRSQSLDPERTDVCRRLTAIAGLLKRTLGEDIALETDLPGDVWAVTVDGPQLDSSIVNLANNARDAMPRGGTITISTRNATLDQAYARTNPDVAPGDYVLIEVSDTGTGMPPDVAAHAFEPFFTTKGPGHGTGLGLSMVYGFVTQSGGHVRIQSRVGHGTTVCIYLPRAVGSAIAGTALASGFDSNALPGGNETILLVEDNAQVRQTAARQLAALGYRTVEAADGDAALHILRESSTPIDLLFSDIVMPGRLNGYELATTALESRPTLRVLLTSGYSGGVNRRRAGPARDLKVLGKPYGLSDLAQAIRATLDSAPPAPAAKAAQAG